MRPEDLYDAFHEIDDDLLKPLPEAAPRRHPALRWGALAACALSVSYTHLTLPTMSCV